VLVPYRLKDGVRIEDCQQSVFASNYIFQIVLIFFCFQSYLYLLDLTMDFTAAVEDSENAISSAPAAKITSPKRTGGNKQDRQHAVNATTKQGVEFPLDLQYPASSAQAKIISTTVGEVFNNFFKQ
jgi:hypothetical protein